MCRSSYDKDPHYIRNRFVLAGWAVGAVLTFGHWANNNSCAPIAVSPCKVLALPVTVAWPIYWPMKWSVDLFDPTAKLPIPKIRFESSAAVS